MVGGGPGAFIGDAHRKAISLDGTAELVAGCFSRTPEKTKEQGKALGLDPERCYANYKEMAAAERAREDGIDFVVIVTPNNTHYEIVKAFLEAGIHVACDKPLVTTAEEAEELKKIAKYLAGLPGYDKCPRYERSAHTATPRAMLAKFDAYKAPEKK